MRKLPKILAGVALMFMAYLPVAHADGGSGQTPGPGLCTYPAVGRSGMEGFGAAAIYHVWCDMPVEENGSRHRCILAGAASQVNVGVSLFIFSAGLSAPIGVLEGGCDFVCPDGQLSNPPNPPGAWQQHLIPKPCKPRPLPVDAPPDGVFDLPPA